jgi:hypothetical protein
MGIGFAGIITFSLPCNSFFYPLHLFMSRQQRQDNRLGGLHAKAKNEIPNY